MTLIFLAVQLIFVHCYTVVRGSVTKLVLFHCAGGHCQDAYFLIEIALNPVNFFSYECLVLQSSNQNLNYIQDRGSLIMYICI